MKNNIDEINKFQQNLIDWYDKEARELPWRSNPTPYRVWISEMMLQQTRVDTVIPYFTRFMDQVPTVQALAEIEEDNLLKLWQGLGYYNRALNLKKAAEIIVDKFNGQIPAEPEDLITLPGIGGYSAGAIASIAFGKRVPAVDGNVLRITARMTASKVDVSNSGVKKNLEMVVASFLPSERVGDFNQALMDLGATICLPNGEPKCSECPVNSRCMAYAEGVTTEIPLKTGKKARHIERKTVLVISINERFALRKRKAGGLLPNLWEFPNYEGNLTAIQCDELLNQMGINIKKITALKSSKHLFTHLEWHMKGFYILADENQEKSDFVWATKEEICSQYSIPTAFKNFIKKCEE